MLLSLAYEFLVFLSVFTAPAFSIKDLFVKHVSSNLLQLDFLFFCKKNNPIWSNIFALIYHPGLT